jgi:putative addiction module CopG family antidote
MMKVSFSEIDETYLRNKVAHGYYSSLSEAIRDTVRRRREQEQHQLLAALEAGEKAVQDGRSEPFTRALFDAVVRDGMNNAENGARVINPDVLPR